MSFFGKLKRVFSSGGVRLKMHLPAAIRAKTKQLEFTVDLTNPTEEERTVTELTFRLNETVKGKETSVEERSRTGVTYTVDEPVILAPNETRTLPVVMPLTLTSAVAAAGQELPDWARKAEKLVGGLQRARSGADGYVVDATVRVDGFNSSRTHTERMRQGISIG